MRHELRSGLDDLARSIKLLPVALHFAWGDTKARYRRSVLGPLWLVLGTAIGVAGLGYLWTAILRADPTDYVPSLTVGLVVWQFLAGIVTESSGVLVRQRQIIRNLPLPVSFFPLNLILRQLVNFSHNSLVLLAILVAYPQGASLDQYALSLLGLALVTANLLWISVVLGVVGARFRDLEPSVASVIPLIFFLSPVIFRPDQVPYASIIVWLNPFSYFINAIREPLLGTTPSLTLYAVLLAALAVGWAMALWLLARRSRRVPFWL